MVDDTPRPYRIEDLLRVMARLRDPETGCPWDREQTFATIVPYTIEEAYEVADAIARSDLDGLKGELGDLLLQVVYHAHMAEEGGRFAFSDVVDAITAKMIRRHPHVFEDVTFDWPSLAPVLAKAEEEIAELKTALASEQDDERAPASKRVTEEFGDLLFVMANVARHLRIDPEAALRAANAKFVRRFRSIEAALRAEGRTPEDATLEEMDQLWDEAKAAERKAQSEALGGLS
jgi:uncharacterized protein YabN with tetrapyrrole methylase and pyrophosphatase domain